MATFYGSVQGNRGEASRLGSKKSGMTAIAASWEGAVRTKLYWNTDEERVYAHVSFMPWGYSQAGSREVIYDGPVDGTLGE